MPTGTLSFVVSADTVEELERRVEATRRAFPGHLYLPLGDQQQAWEQHLPGRLNPPRDFAHVFTPQQVGGMVPHASHEIGSMTKRAVHWALTLDEQFPVLLDLREATAENEPPLIEMVGTLGGGKTMTAQYIMLMALAMGGLAVDIDPKGDHRLPYLPELEGSVRRIVINDNAEHAGRLDPLRVAPPGEAQDAALSYYMELIGQAQPEWESLLSAVIARVVEQHRERACGWAVIEALEATTDPETQRIGRILHNYATGGLPRLGFARLDDALPDLRSGQLTYIQTRALKLAPRGTPRSEMTTQQRQSRATMTNTALFAMRILAGAPGRLKVANFDEAAFLADDAGRQLMDQVERWSRSEGVVPIVGTQLNADRDGRENLRGHRLIFKFKGERDARAALESSGLDATSELVRRVMTFPDGACVYTDMRGKTALIRVDPGARLLAALDSKTPEDDERPDAEPEIERLRRVS